MTATSGVRVRIAPSPTGPMHIGLARTALYNFLFARSCGGTFVLRIDDTDRERSTEASLRNILETMRWLGLDWDEGPEKGGEFGPYFQSRRMDSYRPRADALVASGWAYPCFCLPEEVQQGRERMQKATGAAIYDRRCRVLGAGERARRIEAGDAHTVRFAIPDGTVTIDDLVKGPVAVDLSQIDDWVMLRADGSPLYNFCSTVDDADMRITHVIRGEEHFMNAVKQTLLFAALDVEPPRFAHLPLILGRDGKKLSKRKAQTDLLDYKAAGYPPEALVNFFTLLGWGFDAEREVFSIDEAIERFDIAKLGKSGSIFDEDKMLWMCGVYVRQTDLDVLVDRVTPFLESSGLVTGDRIAASRPWLRNVVACYQERFRIYSELPDKVAFFFTDSVDPDEKARKNLARSPAVGTYLAAYEASLAEVALPPSWPDRPPEADAGIRLPTRPDDPTAPGPWTPPRELEDRARAVAASLGIGFGRLVHPIRAALTGSTAGASLFDIVYLLGRDKVVTRLEQARKGLGTR